MSQEISNGGFAAELAAFGEQHQAAQAAAMAEGGDLRVVEVLQAQIWQHYEAHTLRQREQLWADAVAHTAHPGKVEIPLGWTWEFNGAQIVRAAWKFRRLATITPAAAANPLSAFVDMEFSFEAPYPGQEIEDAVAYLKKPAEDRPRAPKELLGVPAEGWGPRRRLPEDALRRNLSDLVVEQAVLLRARTTTRAIGTSDSRTLAEIRLWRVWHEPTLPFYARPENAGHVMEDLIALDEHVRKTPRGDQSPPLATAGEPNVGEVLTFLRKHIAVPDLGRLVLQSGQPPRRIFDSHTQEDDRYADEIGEAYGPKSADYPYHYKDDAYPALAKIVEELNHQDTQPVHPDAKA